MGQTNLIVSLTKKGLILVFIVSTFLLITKAFFIKPVHTLEIVMLLTLSLSSIISLYIVIKTHKKYITIIQTVIYIEILLIALAASYILHNKLMLLWIYLSLLSSFIIVGKKFGLFIAGFIFVMINIYYFCSDQLNIIDYFVLIPALVIFTLFAYLSVSTTEKYAKLIHDMAEKDSLTKIYNRRGFFEKTKISNNIETKGILMLDIDFFKKINDTYGHDKGDKVLKEFVKRISLILRNEDIFARIGGEEFTIFFPKIDKISLKKKAKEINRLIKEKPLADIPVTVSIGGYVFKDEKIKEALKKADEALYEAKKTRDAIVIKEG